MYAVENGVPRISVQRKGSHLYSGGLLGQVMSRSRFDGGRVRRLIYAHKLAFTFSGAFQTLYRLAGGLAFFPTVSVATRRGAFVLVKTRFSRGRHPAVANVESEPATEIDRQWGKPYGREGGPVDTVP